MLPLLPQNRTGLVFAYDKPTITDAEADMLGEFTPQGFVPIDVRPPVPAAPGAGPVAVPRGAPAPTSSTAPAGAPPKKKVLAMRY